MPRAKRDLASIFEYIDTQGSPSAHVWILGLESAILTLESNPRRCPHTPESRGFRHLLYGNKPHVYRVIYRINEPRRLVEILHIRHGARDAFNPESV